MITKFKLKKFTPFLVCFIIIAVMLCLLYTDTSVGDDNFFKTRSGQSFTEFIKNRANARIAVDSILTIILQFPQWVWGITTAFLFASIGYTIPRIFISKSQSDSVPIYWAVSLLLLMYNFTNMNEAGWFSTTVNYIWPLAFALISLIPIRTAIDGKKENLALLPIFIIAVIIGCGQEQMAAVVGCFYIIFAVYLYKNKKLTKTVIILAAISLFCLLFMLLGSNNKDRLAAEAGLWFPDFASLSLLDKCYLGFTLTGMDLILTENPLVTAFVILFPVLIYKTDCKKWVKGVSLIPLILECINNIFYDYAWRICPKLEVIVPQLRYSSTFGRTLEEAAAPDYSATVLLLSAIYFLSILICAFMAFKDKRRFICLLLVLAGFASRFIIGFSPSVYGAGYRTYLALYACFISVLVMLFDECRSKVDFSKLIPVMSAVALLQLLNMEYYTALIK